VAGNAIRRVVASDSAAVALAICHNQYVVAIDTVDIVEERVGVHGVLITLDHQTLSAVPDHVVVHRAAAAGPYTVEPSTVLHRIVQPVVAHLGAELLHNHHLGYSAIRLHPSGVTDVIELNDCTITWVKRRTRSQQMHCVPPYDISRAPKC